MEFKVDEVAKTTFEGTVSKLPVFVATLKNPESGAIRIKEDNESSFKVDEIWELTKQ